MDEEEDDDIYASTNGGSDLITLREAAKADSGRHDQGGEDLEEGEEEGEEVEESDSVNRMIVTVALHLYS